MNKTILQVVNTGLDRSSNEICFSKKKHGEWVNYTKKDYIKTSDNIAFGLLKKGITQNDKVIIASENTPEWNYVDFALLKLGVVSVPVYATISDEQLEIIMQETEAKFAFVSNKYLNKKIKDLAKKLNLDIKIYSFNNIDEAENIHDLTSLGEKNKNSEKLKEIAENINPEDVYSILYTSGTTGHPKGVMLSHKNHLVVLNDVVQRTHPQDNYKTILYLPLNNSFGKSITYVAQMVGMTIHYVNGIAKLQQAISEVKPDYMATAPLLLEKIMMAALQTGESLGGEIKEKFEQAKKVINSYEYSNEFFLTDKYKQAEELFFSKWRNFLGGNMKTLVTGGALVSESVHNFFRSLKMEVLSGYGLTETSGVVSLDSFDKQTKPGFCGQHLTGVKLKISEEGEILAKGDNIMQGYYKHPEITKETIDKDGWIHTGDLGEIDSEGYLSIKGRIKSSFKLISGDYIYPETIEEKLKKNNYIGQVVIAGLSKEYITVLIIPNFDAINEWAKQKNIKIENINEIVKNKEVNKLFSNIIEEYNNMIFSHNQRIGNFKLLADQWSIDTEEITPTMKIRRNYILEKYKNIIDELY